MDLHAIVQGSQSVVVFDVEGTCWKGVWSRRKETIEIGAVRYRRGTNDWPEFQTFVRPVQIPKLSQFCQEFTGITQADVDAAPVFADAFHAFLQWAQEVPPVLLASWGTYDLWQLDLDLESIGLPKLEAVHLDVRRVYHRLVKADEKNFAAAAAALGVVGTGRAHRAIDDARTTASILDRLLSLAPS